jgi:hypothetical protein
VLRSGIVEYTAAPDLKAGRVYSQEEFRIKRKQDLCTGASKGRLDEENSRSSEPSIAWLERDMLAKIGYLAVTKAVRGYREMLSSRRGSGRQRVLLLFRLGHP